MKVSTRPELFPCAEVIDWILPRVDTTKMILSNINGQGFSTYILAYVAQACKLPTPQIYLTKKWMKELDLDVFNCVRKMMVHGNLFCTKPSGEYETANLRTPYQLLYLMLNQNFSERMESFIR